MQYKIFFFILLFASVQTTWAQVANTVKLDRLEIQTFPLKRPDGDCWDNSLGACYADVYFTIKRKSSGKIEYTHPTTSRAENVQTLPFTLADLPWLKDLEDEFIIDFYDFDSITTPDYLGSCSVDFREYAKRRKSPPEIKIETQNITLTIFLKWYHAGKE